MASRPYTWAVMRMSLGFFFLFMAFNTAQSLESTVVVDNQLVNASLALLYGTFTAFTIVAPKVINLLGPRLSMALGAIPYVLLVFANIKPSWGLFIPAFAGVGIGAALLWTAQGISLSRCAIQEAAQTGESMDLVTSRFNGIFWTTFQFNGAVGLTVGATIISLASDYSKALTYLFLGFGVVGALGNAILFTVPVPASGTVAARTAPGAASHTASSPLVAAGSDDLVDEEEVIHDDASGQKVVRRKGAVNAPASGKRGGGGEADAAGGDASASGGPAAQEVSLVETLRLFVRSRRMQLLIPIIFYTGASLGYNGAMFPLTYQDRKDPDTGVIDENLVPSKYVGYIAASFFLCNSLCSYAWGKLLSRIGRRAMFATTLVTHIAYYAIVYIFLKRDTGLEHGSAGAFLLIFATAAIFAIGDSVLESQLPALIQSPSFFPNERDRDAANSNVRLWQSLGYTVQFGIGIAAPNNVLVQTYFVFPLLLVAMVALVILHTCEQSVEPAKDGAGAGQAQGGYSAIVAGDEAGDVETVHTMA